MQVNITVECTPAEARAFLGLPNLEPINDAMVARVKERIDTNLDLIDPGELTKQGVALGGAMRDQFCHAMTAAAAGAEPAKKS